MASVAIAAYFLPVAVFAAQSVDGRVVDAVTGGGIAGVEVLFRGTRGNLEPGMYRAATNAQGRFHLDDVAEGAYQVDYRVQGYWPVHYAGDVTQPTYAVSAAGPPLHLEVKLQPIPRLSGRVVDPDGKPVAHASVRLMQQNQACFKPSCFSFTNKELATDEDGEFSTAEFQAPGTWIAAAIPPSTLESPRSPENESMKWAETFYPGVPQAALASLLAVRPGVALPFLEIKLATAPSRRVRGRVLDPQGQPASHTEVTLYNGFGDDLLQLTDGDGAFDFPGVTAGEWRLIGKLARNWAIEPVMVGDRDPDDIKLRLDAPFSLRGSFVFQHPDGAPDYAGEPTDILANRESGDFGPEPAPSAPIGHATPDFQFELNLYHGRYTFLMLEPPKPPYYIDAIRLGNIDALTAEGVQVSSADQPLTIVLKYGGGTVRGAVDGCNGGRAVLFPTDAAVLNLDFIREAKCDANGQFEIANVRPGDYYGLAVTSQAAMDWWPVLSEDAIKPQAARITVRDGETTHADIRLLRF